MAGVRRRGQGCCCGSVRVHPAGRVGLTDLPRCGLTGQDVDRSRRGQHVHRVLLLLQLLSLLDGDQSLLQRGDGFLELLRLLVEQLGQGVIGLLQIVRRSGATACPAMLGAVDGAAVIVPQRRLVRIGAVLLVHVLVVLAPFLVGFRPHHVTVLGARKQLLVLRIAGVGGVVVEILLSRVHGLTPARRADGVAHPLSQVDAQPHIVPGEAGHVAGRDALQTVVLAPVDVGPHRVHAGGLLHLDRVDVDPVVPALFLIPARTIRVALVALLQLLLEQLGSRRVVRPVVARCRRHVLELALGLALVSGRIVAGRPVVTGSQSLNMARQPHVLAVAEPVGVGVEGGQPHRGEVIGLAPVAVERGRGEVALHGTRRSLIHGVEVAVEVVRRNQRPLARLKGFVQVLGALKARYVVDESFRCACSTENSSEVGKETLPV